MPIVFSYDIRTATPTQRNHIQSLFERFGWEGVGGSNYRYPKLQSDEPEDWLNFVVPALMLFRSYVRKNSLRVTKYSVDTHVSTGKGATRGSGPLASSSMKWETPYNKQFGLKNLKKWMDDVVDAVPYP